jgi:RHS repeat-associated protein
LLYATFDLTGAALGAYDVQLQDGAQTATAPGAFTVVAGVSKVAVNLLGPAGVRVGREEYLVVSYANNGNVDAPAPLYRVSATGALFRLPEQSDYVANLISFLAVAPYGPAGVLRPGQHGQEVIRVYVPPSTLGDTLPVQLSGMTGSTPIDWSSFKDTLRTPDIPSDAWDVIFAQFLTQVGTTTTDLQKVLDGDATYLSQVGVSTDDVNRLLSFEVQKANASLIGPVLASRVDASYPTPGLPLTFSADFLQPIAGRYRLGPMGRGWVDNWEISETTDASGNVLFDFAGSPRFFVLRPDGSYGGAPGDAATLTKVGGVFQLREADGTVEQFLANGLLDFVQDTNGNRITAGYDSNGRLISLTHSSGAVLTIAYNAQGRVSSVTDPAGRVTSYTYDASGEHLVQVTDAAGTVSYQYVTGQGAPSENALAQVTNIDGTSVFYTYDAEGRLAGTHLDGNAEPVTISYDGFAGVTFTDAANDTATVLYDDLGHPVLSRDQLGRTTSFSYNTAGNLIRTLSPTGLTTLFSYDGRGNLTRETDALGHVTQFVHGTNFNQLLSYTDANGNTTRYSYDSQANLRSITYAGGTTQQFSYDPLGNLTETINARSDAIDSAYNANRQVTRNTFADGSHQDFTYDAHGNLLTARTYDAFGAVTSDIRMTYDAADRLTRIDYLDSNRFLVFTYDSGGRRMSSVDQDGYTVNYTYDTLGRLATLHDGSNNLIVSYTYDPLGRLSRKDLGNGTFTTYTYDAAGELLTEVNSAPGGAVNSSFAYTYDAEGRRTSMTTQGGTTTYAYDDVGQLTLVTMPGGRTIAYTYDAAGNRVKVVDSLLGTTTYTTNSVNEYTSINGVAQTYDADGNLTGDGTNTYTWNDLNQLTSVAGPGGTTVYQYDALGDRIAATQNAVQTQYLIDPTGLGNVVGQYGPGSAVQYAYGLGLVSRTDASGTSFFDFDGSGNTAGITGAAGSYVNRYSYLPFGATSVLFASLTNPFTFAGEVGVTTDGSGLVHMRARDFGPSVGQFLSPDPIGLSGGDANLRRYVENNPVTHIDPRGTTGEEEENVPELSPMERRLLGGGGSNTAPLVGMELLNSGINAATKASTPAQKKLAAKKLLALSKAIFDAIPEAQPDPNAEYKREREQKLKKLYEEAEDDLQALEDWQLYHSHDPNDLIGPGGFGTQEFIQPTGTWGYTVHFENDPGTATAPAQDVVITESIDPNLDWSTFAFGDFGFGSRVVEVPAGVQQYQTQVDYQNTDSSPLTVDVSMDFNRQTGVATWTLRSIDPTTGTFPLGVLAGFLPVDDSTGRGEGLVTYLVQPKPTLTTGTTINAQASIVFDVNSPVVTRTYTNTIDSGAPTSRVTALPATTTSTSFLVNWSGNDDSGGSGIASYSIFVKQDTGTFQPFLTNTTQTSATFTGQPTHTYAFYSIATDNVGNVQPTPASAQTSITIQAIPTVSASDAGGTYNRNPYPASATATYPTGTDISSQGTLTFTYYVGPNTNGTNLGSTAPTNADTYTVVAHFVSGNSIYANADSSPVTFTIAKAPLTVTAANQSRPYSSPNPTLTGTLSGVVSGDNITASYTTTATAASHVVPGGYAITPVLNDPNNRLSNYGVTSNNGTLTITPVALTITADSKSMTVGGTFPTLTASYSSFVNGDTSTSLTTPPTLSTTATPSSSPGIYPITVNGAVDPDYTIGYVNGTLTVTSGSPSGTVVTEQIGDGNVQRSMVTSITLTFASPIASTQLSTVLANLNLTMTANDATDPGPFISTANPSQLKLGGALDSTRSKLTLTFTGSSIIGGSLPDGRYTLSYGGTSLLTSNQLWRLYGDLYGNGTVTSADVAAFTTAYGINGTRKGFSNYNAYLDYYANGLINITDKQQFQCRIGMSI